MKNIFTAAMFLSSALAFNNAMSAGDVRVPDIEGKAVLSSGTKIGDVDRVATTGTETVVIIGLSDGTKEVAIPLSSVTVAADGTVSTHLTKAQLETYEDIDPMDFKEVTSKVSVDLLGTARIVPDIEDEKVMDSAGKEIGEVERVAMDGTNKVVIIELNGSEKEVAVPMSSVNVAANGTVTTSVAKATLETYEDVDRLDFKKVSSNVSVGTTIGLGSRASIPDIEDNKVMDSAGMEIGEVERVALDGTNTVVIIDLKGTEKEVAVPLSSVNVAANGTVTTSVSKSTLETYKDVDRLDFKRVN